MAKGCVRYMNALHDFFDIQHLLYENQNTVIYKAAYKADGKRVIVKWYKSADDTAMIRHEYDILKNKQIAGIANVQDIIEDQDHTYLVSQDRGGIVLDIYMQENAISERDFIAIARNAATALASIHQHNIIHRDIKPSNILIDPKTLQVWFIDFGIAKRYSQQSPEGKEESIQGTLEYISPEQTGRIGTEVDFRSDLYSLGITFYQILTGSLPFDGESKMELIHAHIAATPPPPNELVDVEDILSDVIMKLISKAPAERYQTATALAYDLNICYRAILAEIAIRPFTLGEKDMLIDLDPGKRLYGKDTELTLLQDALERVIQHRGKSEIILLHGPESVGKTALVNEFEKYVNERKGYVLRGEFEQIERNEPYYVLRETFERFDPVIRRMDTLYRSTLDQLKARLGTNLQVLVYLLPYFERIVGKQPALVSLNPSENQKRVEQVFKTFLQILSAWSFPLVYYFENAQWADRASLRLFLSALEDGGIDNCLVIVSYRDDDPTAFVTLPQIITELKRAEIPFTDITMGDLSYEQTKKVLEEIMRRPAEDVESLAGIVYDASGGNIYKISLFLKRLHEGYALYYDQRNGCWQWDEEMIREDKGGIDLQQIFSAAFKSFQPETRHVLQVLSCWGLEFDLEQVLGIYGLPATMQDMMETLQPAFRKDIIQFNDKIGLHSFQGANMQHLCYETLSDEEKRDHHYRIGHQLYEVCGNDEKKLFQYCVVIADHLNKAGELAQTEADRLLLLELNLMSGHNAMLTANISKAVRFFGQGLVLLEDDAFDRHYRLAFDLYLHYASCTFLLQEYKKSEDAYRILFAYVKDDHDRYIVYARRAGHYIGTADFKSAIAEIKDYLGQNGFDFEPGWPDADQSQQEYEIFMKNAETKNLDYFLTVGMSTDKTVQRVGSMLAMLAEACFLMGTPDANFYVYKAFNYAFDNGTYPGFERSMPFAALRRAINGDYARAKEIIECGFQYAEKYNVPQCALWTIYGIAISHWVNPLKDTAGIYKKAKSYALSEGNVYYRTLADLMILHYYVYTGENLQFVLQEAQASLHNAQRSNLPEFVPLYRVFKQYAKCLLGKTSGADSFDDRHFSEKDFLAGNKQQRLAKPFYMLYRMQALYIHGFYDKVLEYAEAYEPFIAQQRIKVYYATILYDYYKVLAMVRLCCDKGHDPAPLWPAMEKSMEALKERCAIQPDNFAHAHLLVQSEMGRMRGGDMACITICAKADAMAAESGYMLQAAIIQECAASFWQAAQIPQYANLHLSLALSFYQQIKARVRIWQLSDQASGMQSPHSALIAPIPTIDHTTTASSTTDAPYALSNANLDSEAILNAISYLTPETKMESLTDKLLTMLLHNSGAERAFLFVNMGEESFLTAYKATGSMVLNHESLPMAFSLVNPMDLPKKIVQTVLNKQKEIAANREADDFLFLNDPYIEERAPKSLVCMPITAKDKLLGAVYLENTQLDGVFTQSRVDLIGMILLQASALIQNVIYYADLQDYAKNLEHRLKAYVSQLNSLISGIAHEINSPVGVCVTVMTRMQERAAEVARSFRDMKLSKTALEEFMTEMIEGLDIVVNNINRAADLIQNFKKVSVDQSNEIFEELDLMAVIYSIIEYIRPAVRKNVDRISVIGPESLPIVSSSGVLAQIFTNLIMNASIHGFEHMRKEDTKITIKIINQEHSVQIIFTDNGKGMDEEELSKVFQPFFTTKRNQGGSGLGAHIILTHVTQTLGGSVNCVSTPGSGTSYIIQLPKMHG